MVDISNIETEPEGETLLEGYAPLDSTFTPYTPVICNVERDDDGKPVRIIAPDHTIQIESIESDTRSLDKPRELSFYPALQYLIQWQIFIEVREACILEELFRPDIKEADSKKDEYEIVEPYTMYLYPDSEAVMAECKKDAETNLDAYFGLLDRYGFVIKSVSLRTPICTLTHRVLEHPGRSEEQSIDEVLAIYEILCEYSKILGLPLPKELEIVDLRDFYLDEQESEKLYSGDKYRRGRKDLNAISGWRRLDKGPGLYMRYRNLIVLSHFGTVHDDNASNDPTLTEDILRHELVHAIDTMGKTTGCSEGLAITLQYRFSRDNVLAALPPHVSFPKSDHFLFDVLDDLKTTNKFTKSEVYSLTALFFIYIKTKLGQEAFVNYYRLLSGEYQITDGNLHSKGNAVSGQSKAIDSRTSLRQIVDMYQSSQSFEEFMDEFIQSLP